VNNKKYIVMGILNLTVLILIKLINFSPSPFSNIHNFMMLINDIIDYFSFLIWGKIFSDIWWRDFLKRAGTLAGLNE
jgi:hypothetical protein